MFAATSNGSSGRHRGRIKQTSGLSTSASEIRACHSVRAVDMASPLVRTGYDFLLAVGKVAGGITFIFGIFYGAYQYFEVKKEKQVEETLSLYRQFNNAPIITYRESIFKALSEHRE
jgi:hypothetical protein